MLDQMAARLKAAATFEDAIATILADVVALHGAEFGNVQLAAEGKLIIVAEHGFRAPFLFAFDEVEAADGCACGRALQTGEQIIVADVELDPSYAPYRHIAREAGYRSVQSTPLIATDGTRLGMVSTHFANQYVPTAIEMAICKAYCTQASDYLQSLLAGSAVGAKARELHDALYADLRTEPAHGELDKRLQDLSLAKSV